ncbi:MAG: MHYT domain-containing protein, partial [Pseudomonadota bacterium]
RHSSGDESAVEKLGILSKPNANTPVSCQSARSTHLRSMEFLDVSHSPGLVAASLLIAIVAGFTGLSLTKNLSKKPLGHRKIAVALASIALGGGIWSMHFVAMLGMQMPILFYYDAAITLASALLAILIVAAALITLHFTERSRAHIAGAGALVGIGIAAMHYVGMSALELCRAIHSTPGVIFAGMLSVLLCILAFGVAYHQRTNRNLLLGTFCFSGAVATVHWVAMAGTEFVEVETFSEFGPVMSNEVLAIGVIFSSFVIFGAFLWVGVTYLGTSAPSSDAEPERALIQQEMRVPCSKDGSKVFILPRDVALVRADGHYTQVYTEDERLFCAWPMTEATKRLTAAGHLQVHRSYLVNPDKVASFQRRKDSGMCTFASDACPQVPVSRSKLKAVQELLGA